MGLFRRSKLATGILTTAVTGALLLGGTFAWVDFSKATNNFLGDGEENGGTLHDDFCAPKKDIYVENWGNSTIYTRIKLFEYMEIGENAGRYIANADGTRSQDPGNAAESLINGANIYDQNTWEPHIPYNNKAALCDTPGGFHDYWGWSMGGWKYYQPAPAPDRETNGYVAQDPKPYNSGSGLPRTLDATVITMASWKNMGSPIGNYWVIDTDGWAYWAAPLAPHTATGLLLNSVNLLMKPSDTYYYGINVWAQMATKDGKQSGNDWNYRNFGDDENGNWTQDGHDLMDKVAGSENSGANTNSPTPAPTGNTNITATNATIIGNRIFVEQGKTSTLTANTTGEPVDWTLPSGSGITADAAGDNQATLAIDSGADTGGRYMVKAASQSNPNDNDTKYVTIIPAGSAVVTGLDGNPYLDNGDNTYNRIYDDGTLGPLVCPPSSTNGKKGTPGGPNDRTDVQIGSDGITKYLGPNSDGSYNKAGPDNLLGTPDDVKVWKADDSKPIGPDNESDTPPANASQVTISQTGAFAIGNNIYLKQGATVNLTANTSGSDVTWSDQKKAGMTLTPDGKTATLAATASLGTKDIVTVAVDGMPSNNDAKTVIVIPSDAMGVVIGQDGKTYIDYGDNTFKEFKDDGSLGPWVCPPSNTNGQKGVPGGPNDRTDITVSGGVKYLGPNSDDSYQKAGPDGLLGTPDDTKVYQKDTGLPIGPGNESTSKVQPISNVPTAVNGRILPPAQTGDKVNWVEIATNGGYSLILRSNFLNINTSSNASVYGNPVYQSTSYGTSQNYTNSTVRAKINSWFNGTATGLADNLPVNARLRDFTMKNNAATVVGTGSTTDAMTNGFSKPTDVKIPSGSDVAFALSYGEAANFCSYGHDIRGANPEVQPSSEIANANFGKISIPQIYVYEAWLRNPGDTSGTVGVLLYNGRVFQDFLDATAANSSNHTLVYPALWVDSSIFNN